MLGRMEEACEVQLVVGFGELFRVVLGREKAIIYFNPG